MTTVEAERVFLAAEPIIQDRKYITPCLISPNCNSGDWLLNIVNCGTISERFYLECANIDAGLCYTFGDVRAKGVRVVSSDFSLARIACSYDVNDFRTLRSIHDWERFIGMNKEWATIMSNYCRLTSVDCPGGKSACSNFINTGDSGELCDNFISFFPEEARKSAESFCGNNRGSTECYCIDPNRVSQYPNLRQRFRDEFVNIDDRCWWKPCDPEVSDDQIIIDRIPDACPDCDVIEEFVDRIGLGKDARQFIRCLREDGDGEPPPGRSYLLWIIIGAIVAVILIILIILAVVL